MARSFFIILFLLSTPSTLDAKFDPENGMGNLDSSTSDSEWGTDEWITWWENIENLYLQGLEYEGLYWLLRHDLETLGYYEQLLANIEMPPPHPDWSDPPGDPSPPVIIYSIPEMAAHQKGSNHLNYGQMPEEWGPLLEAHGIDPSTIGGWSIPAPPMWVAASIVVLGQTLSDLPGGAKVIGKVLSRAGAIIIVWIELEDEHEEEDE
jgi:hypothetical protein